MLDQRRLKRLLDNLGECDEGKPLRVAYSCVEHAARVLAEHGVEPESRSLKTFKAVEAYIFASGHEEDCFTAGVEAKEDSYNWERTDSFGRAIILFNRAAHYLAQAASDYNYYVTEQDNILGAINDARLAANMATGERFVGPEDIWQEKLITKLVKQSHANLDSPRLRASLLAG